MHSLVYLRNGCGPGVRDSVLVLAALTIQFSRSSTSFNKLTNSTMMSSDQYEVIYTLRSELFKKNGFGRFGCRRSWTKDVTPEERKVFMKLRKKGARRGVLGALMGALAMTGVWKIAALGTALGVTGVIAGGLIGAWLAMRASRMRLKLVKKMLKLPDDKSPIAAEAREILKKKLPDNAYAKKLLKKSELISKLKSEMASEKAAPESFKDK